jgi:hypothetical protein
VRALTSQVAEVRKEGARTVEEITKALNAGGVLAPSGKPFTYTTTHRVLKRLAKLGLGDGPRSVSKANSERGYVFRGESSARLMARIARQRPDLLKGLVAPGARKSR